MLAIFDGTVAKHPECMDKPYPNAVSAQNDDFLVNHFNSIYPKSIVVGQKDSFTFAYSVDDAARLPRFHFAHKDDIFCMYQGFIDNIDTVKKALEMTGIDDEALLMIQAFQIMRELGHVSNSSAPKKISSGDIAGNCVSIFYESTSKIILLAGGSYWDLPIYWGIDAQFSLVISNNETIVEKACGHRQPFLCGHVYACCKGKIGLEAIFKNNQPEPEAEIADTNTPVPLSAESVTAMIIQADLDRSKPHLEYWKPPVGNVYKVNTAGIVFPSGKIGIGVIIRNSKGETRLAASRRKNSSLPGLYAGVQAFMEGVYMAVGFKIRRCVFEMGHLNSEKDVEKIPHMIASVASTVVARLKEFSVSFVTDDANKAARVLAKYARRNEHSVWEKETPECIANIVASERPDSDATTS